MRSGAAQTLPGEDLRVGRNTVFTHHTDTGRQSRTGSLWLSGRAPGKEEGWSWLTYMCHTHRLPGNSGTVGDGVAYRGSQAGQDITPHLLSAYSELGTRPRVSPAPSPMSLHMSLGRWLCDFPTLQGGHKGIENWACPWAHSDEGFCLN